MTLKASDTISQIATSGKEHGVNKAVTQYMYIATPMVSIYVADEFSAVVIVRHNKRFQPLFSQRLACLMC